MAWTEMFDELPGLEKVMFKLLPFLKITYRAATCETVSDRVIAGLKYVGPFDNGRFL